MNALFILFYLELVLRNYVIFIDLIINLVDYFVTNKIMRINI